MDPDNLAWALAVALGSIAAAIAFVAIRAWLPGTNDPDSMSSVLYFQRIGSGQHLEVTVLTTPKPLLTLVFGLTWNLVHDWRAIVWETILIHGIGVALATRLAIRVGGLPAGLFVATALIASAPELAEVSQANSLPWVLVGWLTAGLAVTSTRRRFGIAGVALLLAGLVRVETWLILGAATVALVMLAVAVVRSRAPEWPAARSALPLMAAWLAVPIQLMHDYLLTGNPLYWLTVPGAYTALVEPNLRPIGPLGFGHMLLLLLAAVGAWHLMATRRWSVLVGLAGLIGGVLLLLGSLAARGTYVSDRYYEEPDLGLLLAAGIGIGAIVSVVWRRVAGALSVAGVRIAAVAVPVVMAVSLSLPGPLTPALQHRLRALQTASGDLDAVMPLLRQIMNSVQGPAPPATGGAKGFTTVDPLRATAYVPRPLQRRIAIELDVELTRLADWTSASRIARPERLLVPGQYVFHDVNVDVTPAWFRRVDVATEAHLRELHLALLAYKPGAYWLVRVEP